MHQQISQTRRRPEQPRRTIRRASEQFRAEIDFRSDSRGASRPEHPAWVRVGMIGDLVTATEDFRDEVWIFFRARPDDEEGRARVEALEEIEDLRGVRGGG